MNRLVDYSSSEDEVNTKNDKAIKTETNNSSTRIEQNRTRNDNTRDESQAKLLYSNTSYSSATSFHWGTSSAKRNSQINDQVFTKASEWNETKGAQDYIPNQSPLISSVTKNFGNFKFNPPVNASSIGIVNHDMKQVALKVDDATQASKKRDVASNLAQMELDSHYKHIQQQQQQQQQQQDTQEASQIKSADTPSLKSKERNENPVSNLKTGIQQLYINKSLPTFSRKSARHRLFTPEKECDNLEEKKNGVLHSSAKKETLKETLKEFNREMDDLVSPEYTSKNNSGTCVNSFQSPLYVFGNQNTPSRDFAHTNAQNGGQTNSLQKNKTEAVDFNREYASTGGDSKRRVETPDNNSGIHTLNGKGKYKFTSPVESNVSTSVKPMEVEQGQFDNTNTVDRYSVEKEQSKNSTVERMDISPIMNTKPNEVTESSPKGNDVATKKYVAEGSFNIGNTLKSRKEKFRSSRTGYRAGSRKPTKSPAKSMPELEVNTQSGFFGTNRKDPQVQFNFQSEGATLFESTLNTPSFNVPMDQSMDQSMEQQMDQPMDQDDPIPSVFEVPNPIIYETPNKSPQHVASSQLPQVGIPSNQTTPQSMLKTPISFNFTTPVQDTDVPCSPLDARFSRDSSMNATSRFQFTTPNASTFTPTATPEESKGFNRRSSGHSFTFSCHTPGKSSPLDDPTRAFAFTLQPDVTPIKSERTTGFNFQAEERTQRNHPFDHVNVNQATRSSSVPSQEQPKTPVFNFGVDGGESPLPSKIPTPNFFPTPSVADSELPQATPPPAFTFNCQAPLKPPSENNLRFKIKPLVSNKDPCEKRTRSGPGTFSLGDMGIRSARKAHLSRRRRLNTPHKSVHDHRPKSNVLFEPSPYKAPPAASSDHNESERLNGITAMPQDSSVKANPSTSSSTTNTSTNTSTSTSTEKVTTPKSQIQSRDFLCRYHADNLIMGNFKSVDCNGCEVEFISGYDGVNTCKDCAFDLNVCSIAMCYNKIRQPEEAPPSDPGLQKRRIVKACRANTNCWMGYKTMAGKEYSKENYKRAIELYTLAIETIGVTHDSAKEEKAKLLGNRAAAYLMLQQLDQAIADCNEAVKVFPFHITSYLRAGRAYILGAQVAASRKQFILAKGLLRSHPKETEKYANSEQQIKEGLQNTDALETAMKEAKWCMDSGDHGGAVEHTNVALGLAPHSKLLLLQKAKCLVKLKLYKLVINLCESIVNKAYPVAPVPDYTAALGIDLAILLARVFRYVCRSEEATNLLNSILKVNPTHKAARNLQETWLNMENLKIAGNEAFNEKVYAQAHEYYLKALRLDPLHDTFCATIYCNRAAVFMGEYKYEKAISACDEALLRKSTYLRARLRRARCCVFLKRYDEALRDFDSYLILKPGDSAVSSEKEDVKKLIQAERREKQSRENQRSRPNIPGYRNRQSFNHRWGDFGCNSGNSYPRNETRYPGNSSHSYLNGFRPAKKSLSHYEVLEVSNGASIDMIKKSYKRLALLHHPDKSKNATSTELFQQITNAYSILSCPLSKAQYDREKMHEGYGVY